MEPAPSVHTFTFNLGWGFVFLVSPESWPLPSIFVYRLFVVNPGVISHARCFSPSFILVRCFFWWFHVDLVSSSVFLCSLARGYYKCFQSDKKKSFLLSRAPGVLLDASTGEKGHQRQKAVQQVEQPPPPLPPCAADEHTASLVLRMMMHREKSGQRPATVG